MEKRYHPRWFDTLGKSEAVTTWNGTFHAMYMNRPPYLSIILNQHDPHNDGALNYSYTYVDDNFDQNRLALGKIL